MNPEEQKELLDKIKQEVTNEMKKFQGISKEEVEKIVNEAVKNNTVGLDEEKLKELNEDIEDLKKLSEKVNNLVKIEAQNDNTSYKSIIKSVFNREGLVEDIRKIHQAGSGKIDITKAVGNVTIGNVTTDSGGNALLDYLNADDIEALRLRETWVEQFATVTRTAKPVYTYAEWVPGEGDAAFVAEGAAKPQVDHDLQVATVSPVKVAAYEVLSEEAIDDVPRMESTSREVILKRVMLKRQNGVLFGDGVGANPTGLTTVAPTFSLPTGLDQVPNGEYNDYAGVVAAITQIRMAENHANDVTYLPNLIVMNPVDIANLKLKRETSTGNYLFPAYELLRDNTIETIPVISKKEVPAGSVLVGDFTKLNIVNYIDFSINMGWINDQFINNLFTMLGESRFYTYVKAEDQIAFVYDTFANIQTALEAI